MQKDHQILQQLVLIKGYKHYKKLNNITGTELLFIRAVLVSLRISHISVFLYEEKACL